MINLSAVINSPMLSQTIRVRRRSGEWQDGTFVVSDGVDEFAIPAIVTNASARDMDITPNADRQKGSIKVVTQVPIYVTGEQTGAGMSDTILYLGEEYRVQEVSNDSPYGFYRSVCSRLIGEVS